MGISKCFYDNSILNILVFMNILIGLIFEVVAYMIVSLEFYLGDLYDIFMIYSIEKMEFGIELVYLI